MAKKKKSKKKAKPTKEYTKPVIETIKIDSYSEDSASQDDADEIDLFAFATTGS